LTIRQEFLAQLELQEFLTHVELDGVHAASRPYYIAVIGIDRFARIRAAMGYELAEALVQALTVRVVFLFPTAITVRLAPDTIGTRLPPDVNAEAVAAKLATLRSELEQSVVIEGHRVHAGVRVGYASASGKIMAGEEILHRAEMALDQAREKGRGLHAFSEEDYGDPRSRLALLDEMRLGLDQGEVALVYQPQACTRSGKVTGVEALMRWTSRTRGVVPPSQFIATAEETGQVRYLTEFAIQRALEDWDHLAREGFPVRIAVNISSRLFTDSGFIDNAFRLLGGMAERLSFEITETTVVEDWNIALDNLKRFSAAGVELAIDDYGSGLSSLAYVQQLPIQKLKIDKSFIGQLTTTHRDPLLVRSTIELGHALDLEVVGEGVEDAETLALLSVMGCDVVQGYYVGRPMPLSELIVYLQAGKAQQLMSRPFAHSLIAR
jgi:EAL domain-containing protein (putative c-di-GMP-specific phosphodiesterase class I)/GGDEF domain-containing protein